MPAGRAVVVPDGVLPDPETVARVAWLERSYDLVFVACVGRFTNKLGVTPSVERRRDAGEAAGRLVRARKARWRAQEHASEQGWRRLPRAH
jgi:hypothetical protein